MAKDFKVGQCWSTYSTRTNSKVYVTITSLKNKKDIGTYLHPSIGECDTYQDPEQTKYHSTTPFSEDWLTHQYDKNDCCEMSL